MFKKDQIGQVNPPKFDCCVDMSNLTYLNDASVLWNLRIRYVNELIYTYSGLFCIAVNPYKVFLITFSTIILIPSHSSEVSHLHHACNGSVHGKKKERSTTSYFCHCWRSFPGHDARGQESVNLDHVSSVTHFLLFSLIFYSGESGAGKTENTKKVISYFASIGATGKKKEGEPGLEDKIVQTNPVLEAWGNAKTVRNDNSSRFGKFIRIHFNQSGKLAGADMVVYLLEKSRLTYQQPLERCYHSFYNLMSDAVPSLKAKCLLSNDVRDYHYVSQVCCYSFVI